MHTIDHADGIVRQFRDWLAQAAEDIESLDETVCREYVDEVSDEFPDVSASPAAGMLQLAEAFTALRHEVKLHTKSARGMEESLAAALGGLRQATGKFESVQADEQRAAETAARPVIESLVELDESLRRGAGAFRVAQRAAEERSAALEQALVEQFEQLSSWRKRLARFWHQRALRVCRGHSHDGVEKDLAGLWEGFQLIQKRVQTALDRHEVRRIECLGQRVDPAKMAVVELVDDPAAGPETVVEEVRPGYLWRDEVVKFAEVRATRSGQDA